MVRISEGQRWQIKGMRGNLTGNTLRVCSWLHHVNFIIAIRMLLRIIIECTRICKTVL